MIQNRGQNVLGACSAVLRPHCQAREETIHNPKEEVPCSGAKGREGGAGRGVDTRRSYLRRLYHYSRLPNIRRTLEQEDSTCRPGTCRVVCEAGHVDGEPTRVTHAQGNAPEAAKREDRDGADDAMLAWPAAKLEFRHRLRVSNQSLQQAFQGQSKLLLSV